jgi:hypothetical protein
MPFSWVKVSTHTSHKLRDCVGDDGRRVHVKHCIETLTEKAGGTANETWFELNGKYARVLIEWATPDEKAKIVLDLEAEDVIDLYAPEEIDELAAERYSAD